MIKPINPVTGLAVSERDTCHAIEDGGRMEQDSPGQDATLEVGAEVATPRREHRLAALYALGAPPVERGGNLDAWCDFGGAQDALLTQGRLAQAIADAEARGRAAERADVLAWLRRTTDGTRGCREWVAFDVERGKHVASPKVADR